MSKILKEGRLEFNFSSALNAFKFDSINLMTHHLKGVDFIVEWEYEIWFVEVKDPLAPNVPEQHKERVYEETLEKISSKSLFKKELGPKFKDTCVYQFLMNQL